MAAMIGTTLGKTRIVETLGRGGMGTGYRTVDETLDREVAIKLINPDLLEEDVQPRELSSLLLQRNTAKFERFEQ